MGQNTEKQLLDKLANICCLSTELPHEQILHDILILFADTLDAPRADLALLDDEKLPIVFTSTDNSGPANAAHPFLNQPHLWQLHAKQHGFAPYHAPGLEHPLWLLSVPMHTETPVALMAFENPGSILPPTLLDQSTALATPLFQTARLQLQQEKDRQLKKQLQVLHSLYEISAGLLTQMSTQEVIFILLRTLNDLLPTALATAFYTREATQWQRVKTYTNKDPQLLAELWPETAVAEHEIQLLEACSKERTMVIGSKHQGDASYFWQNTATTGIRQQLYFPLYPVTCKTPGVIAVTLQEDTQLSQQELALAGALMQQGTAALARVHLYEASQQEQSQLRAILESSKDGIFLVGQDLHIQYVNGQALQILNLPGDTTMWEGRSFPEAIALIRLESRELARLLLRSARHLLTTGDPPPENTADLTLKTQHQLALSLLQRPVYSYRNEILGALFQIRDITEQKTLERLRDDLLHMLVHDMRNPLSIIISTLEMLQDPAMQAASEEIVPLALGKAEGMLNLVVAILDIGRLESGHIHIDKTPTVIQEIVRPLDRYLAFSAKDIRMEIQIPPDLPKAWVDRSFVERIFQNLVDNATKFCPSENGHIRIRAVQEGNWIKAEVYNNGPHIPAEVENHLFKKFVTDNYQGQGYGLGLSFCQLAVEAHGGKIWAENLPEGGVTFGFTLPIAPNDDV